MNLLILILSSLIALSCGLKFYQREYRIHYQWKQIEFGFPNDRAKQEALASGNFIPANALPIDVQPHYNNKSQLRTFVTIPRFMRGVPYTLATVSDEEKPNGPVLKPYPNYEAHNNGNGTNCNAITSAFRVAINGCNQMWVIDSGSVGSHSECPPQLILFDLNTDELIYRYRFNTSVYTHNCSLFINLLVVVRDPAPHGNCSNTNIYVADVDNPGLVVYNHKQNSSWRIQNRYMYPNPNYGLHTVAGESFMLMDGILGLATDNKSLYFHPLASATEYVVDLSVLDKSDLFIGNKGNRYQDFKPLGQRSSECTVSAIDSNKNLYCVNLNPAKLTVWNVKRPFNRRNIKYVNIDSEVLQFVSGMKIVRNRYGNEQLWLLSNRFQKLAAGTQDFSEVNFRILELSLSNINYLSPFGAVTNLEQMFFN